MTEKYTQREWDRAVSWGKNPDAVEPVVNYIVYQNNNKYEFETEEQVWEQIGSSFGGHVVESPTGKDVTTFIPF